MRWSGLRVSTVSTGMKSVRFCLLLRVSFSRNYLLHTCDATKAFASSKPPLRSSVYVPAPKEMSFAKDEVILVVPHVYGMGEALMRRFETLIGYWKKNRNMKQISLNRCIPFRCKGKTMRGGNENQFDHTVCAGIAKLIDKEEEQSVLFPS